MDDYRINTRFNLKDNAERSAAEFLKSLGRKRNQFIVQAVLTQIEENNSNSSLLESIRRIFREEVQAVSVVSQPVPSDNITTELTQEQKAKNAKNVLADLELFG